MARPYEIGSVLMDNDFEGAIRWRVFVRECAASDERRPATGAGYGPTFKRALALAIANAEANATATGIANAEATVTARPPEYR